MAQYVPKHVAVLLMIIHLFYCVYVLCGCIRDIIIIIIIIILLFLFILSDPVLPSDLKCRLYAQRN